MHINMLYAIEKKNLEYVACKLLQIKFNDQETLEQANIYENENFLILSWQKLSDNEIRDICKENFCQTKKCISSVHQSKICYSIKEDKLISKVDGYKKLAQMIIALRYSFTQVKKVQDMYGENWITLY